MYDDNGNPVKIGKVKKNVKVEIDYITDSGKRFTAKLDIGGWDVSPPPLPTNAEAKKVATEFKTEMTTVVSLENEIPLPIPKDAHPIICIPVNTRVVSGGKETKTYGSCFALSDTLMLTAYHNVDSEHIKPFITIEGKEYSITVVKYNKKLDLALCITDSIKFTEVMGLGKDARTNDKVFFQGYPRGVYSLNEGKVIERFYSGSLDLAAVKFDHGYSGCPVTDGKYIVGIAISGVPKDGDLDHTKGMYLPVSVIKAFLDEPLGGAK